jgi:hypothetical protein
MDTYLDHMQKAFNLQHEAFALVEALQRMYYTEMEHAHGQASLDRLHKIHQVLIAAYQRHERRMDATFRFYM